jgi:hypothetical protein
MSEEFKFRRDKRARHRRAERRPGYIAAADRVYKRAVDSLYGSQGAASPIRKIDPVTGEVIAVINRFPGRGPQPA